MKQCLDGANMTNFFRSKKLSQQQSERVQNEKIKNNINPYFSITYIDKQKHKNVKSEFLRCSDIRKASNS